MAYLNAQGGWQTWSLATNAKTDYWGGNFAASYPHKTPDSFAANYPYKSANDFAAQYPDNRSISRTIWFKLDKDEKNIIETSDTSKSGNKWRSRTFTANGGTVKEQMGDSLFNKSNDHLNGTLRTIKKELNNNANANNAAAGQRQSAANSFNQDQANNRNTAAENYNNQQNQNRQNLADSYNKQNANLNNKNQAINNWSVEVKNQLVNAKAGSYATTLNNLNTAGLDSLKNQGLLSASEYNAYVESAVDSFRTDYGQNKLTVWDPAKLGAQPPAGGFDADYYKNTETGQAAIANWNAAQTAINVNGKILPDLDITGRYELNSFLHKYYTDIGKASGDRGNAAIAANQAQGYAEKLTDAEYQLYRDQVLGLASDTNPATILESKLGTVLTAKDKQEQQMFGALTQDSLKQSLEELKKAKKQESTLALFRGLPGYDEIFSINSTLTNSLLGDSGVGGVLSIMGNTEDTKKSLENQLAGVTGVNTSNAAVYNWQEWFDNVLTKRYEEGLTVADPLDAEAQYEIDKEFASKFITDYLVPRFDTSRSMDEFISYMDVTQKEENIFQTQSALDSLRTLADTRAKAYLDGVQSKAALNFDPEFYFSPTDNENRAEAYAEQAQEVAADWEAAKKNDPFWATEAYRYGLDINDKAQFARLHYEVKGLKNDYDAARDVITLKDAEEYIDNTILPAIQERDIALGDTAFLQFVTPEEFADRLIEGVSPEENKEEWQKLLEQFGLDDSTSSVTELRDYIIDALRTGAAKDIRESIKYLNEKKLTPSQKELGTSYIERAEDKVSITSPDETQLYKVFKNAGFQGTEDEFYTEFFPDVDRSEQVALTKAGAGVGYDTKSLDLSDPFAALTSLGSLFETDETSDSTTKTTSKDTTKTPSYFNLFEDDTDDESMQKSQAGQKILGEFTSLFKGFS